MLVLVVLAVMLAMVFPFFKGMMQDGESIRAEKEIQTLKTAVLAYQGRKGTLPADIHAALIAVSPRLLQSILEDPFKTDPSTAPNTYGYTTDTDDSFGDYFIIYSKGPDGKLSTTWNEVSDRVDMTGDDAAASNAPVNKVFP